MFPAPGAGVCDERSRHLDGPRRAPGAPRAACPPTRPTTSTFPRSLLDLKEEAERRVREWSTNGHGLVSSSLYDAGAWFSTGLGRSAHARRADRLLLVRLPRRPLARQPAHRPGRVLRRPGACSLAPDAESIIVLANPVQPHSEGEIVLASADPLDHPDIRMNYYGDPHDLQVMVAIARRVLDIVASWPEHREIGPLMVPPALAERHGHAEGDTPSDALLEDLARHYSTTVYHLTSTCRIGDVVDPRLRVIGVANLRVADASVMPNVVSGNTNAAAIMIGEKAAEMIAADHGVKLEEFVGA